MLVKQTELQAEKLREVHAAVINERLHAIQQLYEEKLLSVDKLVIEKFVAIRSELELKENQLKLQAKEYERRLEALNHEAQRILTAQAQSISVDKYDGGVAEIKRQIDNVDAKAIMATKNLDEKIAAIAKQVYIIMGGIVVIEFALKIFFKAP